jgi:acetyl esterase/lipase
MSALESSIVHHPRRPYLALALALGLLGITIWTIVPPPCYLFFAFGIVSAELSPWFLALSLITLVLAVLPSSRSLARGVGIVLALACVVVCARPLVLLESTVNRCDGEMRNAYGHDYLAHVPSLQAERMRHHPVVLGDCAVGVRTGGAVTTTGVVLQAQDGTPLPCLIYRSQQAAVVPIVVVIHGGGWQRGAAGDNAACSCYLAAHGYLVFSIDYRRAPSNRFPDQLDDVQKAISWIRSHAAQYDADPHRIALLGRSAGSQLALLAAYTPSPERVQAVIAFYTPVDLIDGYRNPPRPDPLHTPGLIADLIGATPDQATEAYRQASPLTFVHAPLPPTLLLHGERDHAIQLHSVEILQQALQANNCPSALLILPWSDHAFDIALRGLGGQLSLFYVERFLAWSLAEHPSAQPRMGLR